MPPNSEEDFVLEPVRQFVDRPKKTFLAPASWATEDTEPPGVDEEIEWEKQHPQGRYYYRGASRLVLWNFAVGDAVPKTEHRTALQRFVTNHQGAIVSGASVLIEGHASASSSEARNSVLSKQRADTVAFIVMRLSAIPSKSVSVSGAGESQPLTRGDSGEALARDRRVEVMVAQPNAPSKESAEAQITQEPAGNGRQPGIGLMGRFVVKVGPVKIPIRDLGTLFLEGEIYVTRLETAHQAVGRVDVATGGKVSVAMEKWVTENVKIVIGERSNISGKFSVLGAPFDIKIEYKVTELEFPATVAISFPFVYEGEWAGVKLKIVGGLIRGSFRPGSGWIKLGRTILTRISPWVLRAGPLVIPLGTIGFVAWGWSNLQRDHERGQETAFYFNIRKGYARRLVYGAKGTRSDSDMIGNELYNQALRIGWEIADRGWTELSQNEQEALAKILKVPTTGDGLAMVLRATGGELSTGPLRHPREVLATLTATASLAK